MFLKNCWYVGAFVSELDDDAVVSRRILSRRVLFYRTAEGSPVAMLDQCPHRLVPLSIGRRIDDNIHCAYHGLVFGSDGQCVHIPGQARIPSSARVQTFAVIERYGHVWIWMGDPALANPATIPEIPWIIDPHWGVVSGYLHFDANYTLVTDNLLDLSHETYIHEGTIGNQTSETIADYPLKITVRDGQGVAAAREMINIDPPPWFAMMLDHVGRIDRWQTAIWMAPSYNMTDTGAAPSGTDRHGGYIGRILHLLTPETETSTHYFWSVSRNRRIDDHGLSADVEAAVYRTFEEDRAVLELQQRELIETGLAVPKLAIEVDNAPLRARRILNAYLKQEAEGFPVPSKPVMMIDGDFSSSAA